ncbi:HdeD family acid-resistance protein [Caballeronia humi]|uniref:Membrane protein n=1 Tax=Caballeronia humi TaxID=326474 RepID=A0A158FDF0_9BURK|nr:DUF308 domain-containing protein [Caballeronia humi]SAL17765.1 membrane protein [Caballeronia humi]
MVQLVLLLLGVDYLRRRWRTLFAVGLLWLLIGVGVFIDALDNAIYFPMQFLAYLLLTEGVATLAVAWTGAGGQRVLRYVKGAAVVLAAALILAGHHHGNFVLSMIFGMLFLADGLLQAVSAFVVRYPRWRVVLGFAIVEILLAIFFFQPYPTHYVGTAPYCLGLGLAFGGWNLLWIALRVRALQRIPPERKRTLNLSDDVIADHTIVDTSATQLAADDSPFEWDGPPAPDEKALTVHVWTPVGSARTQAQRSLIVDRYIAAVDANGVISTGHAALESPEGVYISLYPGVEIDRSPDEFGRILRATRENDVPGVFQRDYATESKAWCESTTKVRIRNYSPERLGEFWGAYRQNLTYNLTYRNCSSTVSNALEAALEGAVGRFHGRDTGWRAFWRLLVTPELWVAAQIRKRAATMAWTPGLTLDYARALSMLADPRPFGWLKMARLALRRMMRSRRGWRQEAVDAADARAGRV